MLSETNLGNSVLQDQFSVDGFHLTFRFDNIKNGRGILLYAQEDITIQLPNYDFIFVWNLFPWNK